MSDELTVAYMQAKADAAKKYEKRIAELEKCALGIWLAKGCGCCENTVKMEKWEGRLAKAIGAQRYDDDSGWDLYTPAGSLEGE